MPGEERKRPEGCVDIVEAWDHTGGRLNSADSSFFRLALRSPSAALALLAIATRAPPLLPQASSMKPNSLPSVVRVLLPMTHAGRSPPKQQPHRGMVPHYGEGHHFLECRQGKSSYSTRGSDIREWCDKRPSALFYRSPSHTGIRGYPILQYNPQWVQSVNSDFDPLYLSPLF